MRFFWLSAIVIVFSFSCNTESTNKSNLLSQIPSKCNVIIKVNNLESLRTSVNNNRLLTELENFESVKDFQEHLTPLNYIQTTLPIYIGVEKDENDSLKLSMVTAYKKNVFDLDSIPNIATETISSKGQTINKFKIESSLFYSSVKDSILFISNKLSNTENFLKTQKQNYGASKFFDAANPDKSVTVFSKVPLRILNFKSDSVLNTVPFSKNTIIDLSFNQDNIYANGITEADSSRAFINCFKGTIPQKNRLSEICPALTSSFISFTSQNMSLINDKLNQTKKIDSTVISTLLDNIVEFGHAEIENSNIIALRPLDVDMTLEELDTQEAELSYRTIEIFKVSSPEDLSLGQLRLLEPMEPKYYINLNEFIILSEKLEVLKTIISNYQNGNTLSNQESYKKLMLKLNDEASIFIFNNNATLQNRLELLFGANTKINTNPYKTSAIQFVYDSDFAHVNAAFTIPKTHALGQTVSEELNLSLHSQLLNNPQFLKNHKTGNMDIAVQDIGNNLYLISNEGKVFWKKQIDGAILGKIEQMDIYKNRRLQLVFSTSSRLYVLDRNGNEVSPFPLKFNDEITQPVSVFDYDNNRNYRLLITQGKALLMYDKLGNPVKGFNYSGAKNKIKTQPKHFRIGRKDYLVFAEGDRLEILSRTGKTRVNVNEDILFSENEVYLYNNSFTVTNINGELLQIKTNGKINRQNLKLKENHKITTTSKTLAAISENELTIKSKKITLDYGNYSEPKIFYLNNKIYVSVTDLQHKKIYLYDSQAKLIPGFPVYGNSSIEMQNIDNEPNLEVITKGDKNSIIVYELQ